jgi:hypothetical protein
MFYATAKPWRDSPSPPVWYGRANDTLAVVQYLALLPVMLGLGRLMPKVLCRRLIRSHCG